MKRKFIREEEWEADRAHQFSEEDIQRIRTLNEKLRKEEKRFIALYDKLKPQLTALCLQRDIDDFTYHVRLCVFSNDRKCNSRNDVDYGDPIWDDKCWLFFDSEDSRKALENNWNQMYDKTHVLANEPFCYTMHCIAFRSGLLWKDVLCIDDVWLSMNIAYQMLSNDKMKKRFYKINKERIGENRLM